MALRQRENSVRLGGGLPQMPHNASVIELWDGAGDVPPNLPLNIVRGGIRNSTKHGI